MIAACGPCSDPAVRAGHNNRTRARRFTESAEIMHVCRPVEATYIQYILTATPGCCDVLLCTGQTHQRPIICSSDSSCASGPLKDRND